MDNPEDFRHEGQSLLCGVHEAAREHGESRGGLKAATKRGALRPILQAISHQTCLKERTVYQLLQVLNLEHSVINGPARPKR